MNAKVVTAKNPLDGSLPKLLVQSDPAVPFKIARGAVSFGSSAPEAPVAAKAVQTAAPTEFSPSKGVTIKLTAPETNTTPDRGERPLQFKLVGAIKAA